MTEGYIWTDIYPESKRIVEKGNKYIIIPIIMNLLFHYYLIPFLVLKYIGY